MLNSSSPTATAKPESFAPFLDRICGWLDPVVDAALMLALIGELVAVTAQVVARVVFHYPLLWSGEVGAMSLATLGFVGGAIAYRRNVHTSIHVVLDALPAVCVRVIQMLGDYIVLISMLLVGGSSLDLLRDQWEELTQVLEIRMAWLTAPVFVGIALFCLYAVERLSRHAPRAVLIGALASAAIIAACYLTEGVWRPVMSGDASLYLMLGVFLLVVFLGLPVGFGLMLAAALYVYTTGLVPLVAVAQNMANSSHHFVLLSLPFFLLAGLIMERGGISLRFVRFAASLVGHLPGGLLQVVVVSIYLVSGVSGSKAADVVAVGSVMREMLMRRGYRPEEAAAVLSSAAAMAETIPPSVAMLVMGSITSVSIASLFLAGLLPAAVLALCLMLVIYGQARARGVTTTPRAPLRQILVDGRSAILPLCLPIMLLVGIRFGYATPTEVSAFAVLFGLVLSSFVYRELSMRDLIRAIVDCATTTGMILFVLAAAAAFAWTLTIADLPQRLAAALSSLQSSRELFMIGTIVLLILMGALLEGLPAILIMAPMLMPTAIQIGVDPVHYAIVMILAMGVGAFLPPIGIGFLVACGVVNAPIGKAERAMRPYLLALLAGIVLLALVPWFTMVVPDNFGPPR